MPVRRWTCPRQYKIKFQGSKEINIIAAGVDPTKGLTGQEAINWFTAIWDNYASHEVFQDYKNKKGREWADEDLKALLVMLTRKRKSGGNADVSGFRKLQPFKQYHSPSNTSPFEGDIVSKLRAGGIVIIDLSQGDPELQAMYSERICRRIFNDGMDRFIANEDQNYIQLYFEEAHNLFPKKDDTDLSQIYNRLAKEGRKASAWPRLRDPGSQLDFRERSEEHAELVRIASEQSGRAPRGREVLRLRGFHRQPQTSTDEVSSG